MSISNDSTNDDFTPAAATDQQQQGSEEINPRAKKEQILSMIGDAFSLDDCGQKEENAEQIGDEKLREEAKSKQEDNEGILKSEKLEMELRVAKQMCAFIKMEHEEKALQAELKQQRLIEENIELKVKIYRIEKEKEKEQMEKDVNANQCKEFLERIVELEKQQKQQKEEIESKVSVTQLTELNLRQNCWDVKFCHNELEITGDDCLTVVSKQQQKGWRTVFAEQPIPSEGHSSGIFYFEIGVEHMQNGGNLMIGFAAKQRPFMSVLSRAGTYAHKNSDNFYINGFALYGSYSRFTIEDIVGCGINLATQQIIFTKNGYYLDASNSLVSSLTVPLFPFVSLFGSGDKIMANFGPTFLIPTN
ncbi:hypothetical protein niasHT_000148 [Heterodera trifolii]|uniref:B30.2/SPRY domain-containing protein n=1 Tax=Heterodera trifolii TaxID=157864 RepID=A0ABD2LQ73_9BILA